MRELKFRAWNEREGMVIIDDLYWFEEEGVHDGTGEGLNQKFELMQFTGLKDKNGKDIYEGDILYDILTFPITVDDRHGYRFMFGKDQLCKTNGVNGLVIGNIHENPEVTVD